MLNILVLGSEGFIGSHLVQYFTRAGQKVYGCDLYERGSGNYSYFKVSRLSPEWEDVFTTQPFDVCINAAGSGNVPYSMSHPFIDFEANTLDTIRVLEAIRRFNATCRYLHLSSAAVYGNPQQLPVSETSSNKPMSPYGWHKLMAEQVCSEYHYIFKLPVSIVRPFSVYGERLRKQLLWDICEKLQRSDSIQLFGTGNESRDFIHVNDLTKLIACIIDKANFELDIFNAASGVESTIRTVAEIFESYHRQAKKITFSGKQRIGDPLQWRADISKISALGFKPGINLSDGVYNFITWFESLPDRS